MESLYTALNPPVFILIFVIEEEVTLDLNNYNEWLQNICFQLSPYFKKNFNINIEEFFSDDIFSYPKFSKFIILSSHIILSNNIL